MQNIGTAYWYTYVMRSTHVTHLSCIHENRKKELDETVLYEYEEIVCGTIECFAMKYLLL